MSRRAVQLAATVVLIVATLTPVVNCFDSWDKSQPPANDTELQVTALFIGVGFALVLPKLVQRFVPCAVRLTQKARLSPPQSAAFCLTEYAAEPSASPPLIPLRI